MMAMNIHNKVPEVTFKPLNQKKDALINHDMFVKDLMPMLWLYIDDKRSDLEVYWYNFFKVPSSRSTSSELTHRRMQALFGQRQEKRFHDDNVSLSSSQ